MDEGVFFRCRSRLGMAQGWFFLISTDIYRLPRAQDVLFRLSGKFQALITSCVAAESVLESPAS